MKIYHSKTMCEILGRNSVHPFPARMAPELVLDVMSKHRKSLRVLDPMSGSGTVIAVARANGHRAIGVDIDPLAVLISRVWTTSVNPTALLEEAAGVLEQARHAFRSLGESGAYPKNADDETRRFARFWFDGRARRQLTSLAAGITDIRDKKIRDALWCAFSRLIITKNSGASLAMDLSHSRPHRAFGRAPVEPFSKFLHSAGHVANNCIHAGHPGRGPDVRVHEGDARKLGIKNGSIDMVFTSPPYLNAIDYMRCSKFSLIWMGHAISTTRRIRHVAIGSEVSYSADSRYAASIISRLHLRPRMTARGESILIRYISDMRRAMGEVARVLVQDGQAVYVVGENTIRGTFIPNSRIVKMLASDVGLRCVSKRSRELPANRRYLPPPSGRSVKLDSRMRREVILTLEKA